METKLKRIAQIAKENPKEQFTGLAHLLDYEMLIGCHFELSRSKAPGVDKVTKDQYEKNLGDNIRELVRRLKGKSYRPQPVKRVYILKPGSAKEKAAGYLPIRTRLYRWGSVKC